MIYNYESPARRLLRFVERNGIAVLNVTDSREEDEQGIHLHATSLLKDAFRELPTGHIGREDEG